MSDQDIYTTLNIPGFGNKRALVLAEGVTVADFGKESDCYVTLESGKRALLVSMSENVQMTAEGGLAIKVINKTGAPSIKGYICEPSDTTDNAIKYTDNDDFDPIGIMYSDGVPDGEEVFIVVSGIAEVYYGTAVVRATFSRVPVVADGIAVSGQALNEPLPAPPLSNDKHFREIGHPIESRGTPGLAKTILHFN